MHAALARPRPRRPSRRAPSWPVRAPVSQTDRPRPDSRMSAQRLRDGPARPGAGPRPRRHGSNQSCLSAASHTLDGCRGTHLALSSSTLSPALPCRGEVPVSFHNGTLQKSLAAFPLCGRDEPPAQRGPQRVRRAPRSNSWPRAMPRPCGEGQTRRLHVGSGVLVRCLSRSAALACRAACAVDRVEETKA